MADGDHDQRHYPLCAYGQHLIKSGTYYVINPEGGYGRREILCCEECIKKPEYHDPRERMIEFGATELIQYRTIQMNTAATTTPATPTTRKPSEPRYYKVRDKVTGDIIYVTANTRHQAENFASYNRWDVTILSIKEAFGLKPEEIYDANAQPGPPKQLKIDVPQA